jgi:hypothetical protein
MHETLQVDTWHKTVKIRKIVLLSTAENFLIDASMEVGLEVNTEKTKYMLLSHHQNAGHNHDIKIGNRYDNKSKPDSGGN